MNYLYICCCVCDFRDVHVSDNDWYYNCDLLGCWKSCTTRGRWYTGCPAPTILTIIWYFWWSTSRLWTISGRCIGSGGPDWYLPFVVVDLDMSWQKQNIWVLTPIDWSQNLMNNELCIDCDWGQLSLNSKWSSEIWDTMSYKYYNWISALAMSIIKRVQLLQCI